MFSIQGCGVEVLLTGTGATRPCLESQEQSQALLGVVLLPGQGRARCFAVGSLSPFPVQLLVGCRRWGCPSPIMSDGLVQGLCSKPPEAPSTAPTSGVHPAPVCPPAPKGYCPSIPGLHPAPAMLSQLVPSAQSRGLPSLACPGVGHAGTSSVPSPALWGDLTASIRARAWRTPEGDTRVCSTSSALDARSLSLQFVFCKTWYISVKKKKVFIKKSSLSEWHRVAFSHRGGCCGGQ